MSFVNLETLTMHRRAEMEGRINTFDEKCDRAISDIKKLKMQARSFLTQLNCDPIELKDRFLKVMKKLDEYNYFITDFNLALGQIEEIASSDLTPVQDDFHKPLQPAYFNTNNLMDALSEPAPAASCACSNLCPPERQKRPKVPKQDQALISFSSSSASWESVPSRRSAETASKEVQCLLPEKMEAVNLDEAETLVRPEACLLPAQIMLEMEHEYRGVITMLSGSCFWVITDDSRELADFMHDLTEYCENNKSTLSYEEARSLTYCVYFDDETKFFYRSMIVREDQNEPESLHLFLVDTGELRSVPASLLQPLPPHFSYRPPYARLCHLAGITIDVKDKELMNKYEEFMSPYISQPCTFIVDENQSETIGVIVICSGQVLNNALVEKGLAEYMDNGPVKEAPKDMTQSSSDGVKYVDQSSEVEKYSPSSPPEAAEYSPHLPSEAAKYSPHLPSEAAKYSPHLPSEAAKYSPHLPSEAAKYSPHLPSEAAKYSPHLPSEAAKYSPHLPSEAAKYSPHLPSEAAKYSPHLPPEAAKYSPHLPPEAAKYSPHLPPEAAKYSPHLPPEAAKYSPHLPPEAAKYSPHLPPEAAKYSPHLPSEAAEYSPHLPPEAAKYSPHLPPEAAKYSPHLPPEAAKYSPHLPPEAAKYSPHLPPEAAKYSPHLPPEAAKYSPHLSPEAAKYSPLHSEATIYSPHLYPQAAKHVSRSDMARFSPQSSGDTGRSQPLAELWQSIGPPDFVPKTASNPDMSLESTNFGANDPEYDDPVVAVTGYHNRDEEDICKHYKGGPDKTCFKGARCTKKHVMKHPDGWTLDKVEVVSKLRSLPLPAPATWLRVQVSHVAHFDRVYVNLLDDNTHAEEVPEFGVILPPKTLAGLIRDMNSAASKNSYQPLTLPPAQGEVVAALYPPDGRWYRARVLTLTRADQSIEVQYIDYGTVLWVKEDQIRVLEPRFCVLPIQAIRCVLAGVYMTSQRSQDWASAKRALSAVLQDRSLHAHVVSRDYDEITVDLVDEDNYSITKQLAAQGVFEIREYVVTDDSHVTHRQTAA